MHQHISKQKISRQTGILMSKQGIEREIGYENEIFHTGSLDM